jgi:hypothetical protein
MFTKPANLKPTASRAPGTPANHHPKATLARAAVAAASCLTARGSVRPILRRTALGIAGTGAAAVLALGPSTPSFAAAIPIVNTTNQAGYVAGNGSWNFRFVQAVVTLPPLGIGGCPLTSKPNYLESSLQLIGAPSGGLPAGPNAAIGVTCRLYPFPNNFYSYRLGWALGYAGSTYPALDRISFPLASGARYLLQLYYNQGHPGQGDQTVKFTACYAVGSPAQCDTTLPRWDHTQSVPVTSYKFAVVSANVANPMPHPPPPDTSRILMRFTDAAVTSYNGTHGSPGINGPWGVQQENERQSPFGGNLVAKPLPPPPETSFDGKAFNIAIYGQQSISP